jgi:peptidoglycan/LPS O-acetylase OafA/YrhL
MNKLPNLDVSRFLLASLVAIGHIPLMSKVQGLPYYNELAIFHKGKEAVYMFFALSGFLIIRLIYLAMQRDAFSIRKFYIRRVLRIFPLYYLVLFVGFTFYHYFLPKVDIPFEVDYELTDGLLMTMFFIPNVFTGMYNPGAIIQVLWSLGIEEQFYLLIAPMAFFIKKGWFIKVLIVLTAVYFIIFHLDVIWFLQEFNFVYYFLFLGGIVSILEERKKLEFLKSSKLIPIIITILVFIYYTTNFLKFENLTLRNLTACILLSLFVHTLSYNNLGVNIRSKSLNYFGKISYGIYMYHVIVLSGVLFLFLKVDVLKSFNDVVVIILINLMTFFFTILLSHFSFKYFEMQFLKLKNKFR